MAEFNGKQGVWRTIGGRRVFIEDGDDLKTAMKKSGKFKNLKKDNKEEKNDKFLQKAVALNERDKGKISEEEYFNKLSEIDGLDPEKEKTRVRENLERLGVEVPDYLKNKNQKENKRTTKEVNDEYNKLSKKMQQDDYYYRPEDDRKLKELRAEYDTLVAKGQEDVNLTEYNNRNKTPYNSKAYAKLLSESYMADEEYEDKVTPKYIQDIEAGRYGNMSDEEAIKNWIDGGADIIYNEDAEKQLKAWGIPVKNDDAYGTYKDELAKQLLPIYKRDRSKVTLSKMALGDLREIARDYNLETKGLSRKELIEKLLSTFGK